jgi:hypothetical protein
MTTTLLFGDSQFPVPQVALIESCALFRSNIALVLAPYAVRSAVPESALRLFIAALEGAPAELTRENAEALAALAGEFQWHGLSARIAAFRRSLAAQEGADCALRACVQALEDRAERGERRIALLEAELFGPARAALAALAGEVARLSAAPGLDSAILRALPPLPGLAGRARLLWRGSRDGFRAAEFHRRCDGRPNTATVVRDTGGSVFGGFTPLRWGSAGAFAADPRRASFLFTLANPHGVAPRAFPLRADAAQYAVHGWAPWGPAFGAGYDLGVADACDSNADSYTRAFGGTYANDTGIESARFFTGGPQFTVDEIEVFEMVDLPE